MAVLFFRGNPDPNVPYAGKLVPKDKAQGERINDVPLNQPYEGKTLPKDKASPVIIQFDPKNNPSLVELWNIDQTKLLATLPPDVIITAPSQKHLAATKILDGVNVYERIWREPTEVEFEFTLRMQKIGDTTYNNTSPPAGASGAITNIFGQDYLNTVWTQVFIPDTVLIVKNTLLNGIGISQLVVRDFIPATVRGSTNIPCRMRCYENVPGQSLIIN